MPQKLNLGVFAKNLGQTKLTKLTPLPTLEFHIVPNVKQKIDKL
jgi:hypothetical protein